MKLRLKLNELRRLTNLKSGHYRICGGIFIILSLILFNYVWFAPGVIFIGSIFLLYKPEKYSKTYYQNHCMNLKYINTYIKAIIDNPIGSLNKESGYIYPLNAGYVHDEASNSLIDVYIVGYHKPIEQVYGKVLAILKKDNYSKEKLIVCLSDKFYTKDQLRSVLEFDKDLLDYTIIFK